jgi:hypothetical protein
MKKTTEFKSNAKVLRETFKWEQVTDRTSQKDLSMGLEEQL